VKLSTVEQPWTSILCTALVSPFQLSLGKAKNISGMLLDMEFFHVAYYTASLMLEFFGFNIYSYLLYIAGESA
jgi:hypothetical protein